MLDHYWWKSLMSTPLMIRLVPEFAVQAEQALVIDCPQNVPTNWGITTLRNYYMLEQSNSGSGSVPAMLLKWSYCIVTG